MSLLSVDELRTLVEQPQGRCVSIYMPTQRAGTEVQQNPIRFKNLIRQAQSQLQEHELRNTDASALLQPAMDLDHEDFWEHQDEGLAIFVADGFFRYYQVPLKLEELSVVGDRFHLKPLMPLLSGDGKFYVLTLNQQQVRFFEGTRYNIHEIELEDVPKSLDEALQYDETAKDGQFRISTSKGGTNNSFQHAGSFHGQGSPDRDKHQEDILQFFHALDRGLHKYLQGKRAPLVIAGIDRLLPIYREANSYEHLLDDSITENSERSTPEQLHQQAWSIVEPLFSQAQESAVEHYRELAGTGKTSTDLQEAIPAAYYGRIDQLFVAVGVQQWGVFDAQANKLDVHPDPQPGDEDLLDSAAIQTLLNGGTVYAVEPDAIPDAAPLAAVFRY